MARFSLIIVLMLSLAGCATTGTSSSIDVNKLRIKVAKLEDDMKDRNQEIVALKSEVRSLSSDISRLNREKASLSSTRKTSTASSSKVTTSSSSTSSTGIIRVKASAKEVQKALTNAGYYQGKIDGKIGAGTKAAIKEFQKDHDLKSDGIIGAKTWSELLNYNE